jgi:predicted deacylase
MRFAIVLLAASAFAQKTIQVGPVTAAPGTAVSGVIPIAKGADAATEIPVTVVNGAKPGPVLAMVAGNHGYEYTPILALQKVRAQLDPAKISGTVILVHAANLPSFYGRTIYFSPVDQKNLNRVYPGRADGTVSERIAYAITKEVVEKSDVVLDLHCGDGNENLRPYVYQAITGDKAMDEKIAALAAVSGFDHVVIDRDRPKDPARSLYLSTTAVTRGKPALTVESGYLGNTDAASVNAIVNVCANVMRHLKMVAVQPKIAPRKLTFFDPVQVVTSPATGILYWKVDRDQMVAKDALLAEITDMFGKKIADVRAPFAGKILYIVATPPITKDQPVAFVGAIRTTDPLSGPPAK